MSVFVGRLVYEISVANITEPDFTEGRCIWSLLNTKTKNVIDNGRSMTPDKIDKRARILPPAKLLQQV